MTAPGWYPDPSNPTRQRYFDGRMWTENYAPASQPTPVVGQPPNRGGMGKGAKIGLFVGAAVLGLIALGSIGNSDKSTSTASGTRSSVSSVAAPETTNAPTAATTTMTTPTPTPTTTTTTTTSGSTPAQKNAIAKAKSYLDFSAFSKEGLIQQLEFDKFDAADAAFAVEQLEANGEVDWNEQAAKKAESYMEFSSFSKEGLIQQLEFDKFTPAQATYGANSAYGG